MHARSLYHLPCMCVDLQAYAFTRIYYVRCKIINYYRLLGCLF